MRLLLLGDLHYSLPQLDWLVDRAAGHDVVVLAGDHLDISSAVPLEVQAEVLQRYFGLLAERTTLVVSSGNHDLTGPDAAGEQAALWLAGPDRPYHGDGDVLRAGDVTLTVCPWWDGPEGRRRVDEQLRATRPTSGRWVWVYHWPPAGSPVCWTGKRHYGDPDLLAWVEELGPDLVLTGHVHESPFKDAGHWADRIGSTWVLNAGRQIGQVPVHVEVDLAEQSACWRSMLGDEEQDLTAASPAARAVL